MAISKGLGRLQIRDLEQDRFARSATITLNGLTLKSPYFFSLVQNLEEASSLREIVLSDAHFGGSVVRIFDAPGIVGSRVANYQMTFDSGEEFSERESRRYRESFPII